MKEKVEDSEKKSVQKPLSVMMVDARNELVKAINDISRKNGLSFFLLDLVMTDVHQEIVSQKNIEMEKERMQYENDIAKKESEEKK